MTTWMRGEALSLALITGIFGYVSQKKKNILNIYFAQLRHHLEDLYGVIMKFIHVCILLAMPQLYEIYIELIIVVFFVKSN